jgi:large subunit ribosomal protein L4
MVALALRSALSDRARDDRVVVVDDLAFDAPKTKDAVAALSALGLAADERVLVVLGRDDEAAWKSLRNLAHVDVLLTDELNTYDILCNDWLVFTSATLRTVTDRLAAGVKRGDHGATPVALGGEDARAASAEDEEAVSRADEEAVSGADEDAVSGADEEAVSRADDEAVSGEDDA